MEYRFHEGRIELPDDWRDESLTILKAPETEGYNLVISRERIPKGLGVDAHLTAQRGIIEENLNEFREINQEEILLAGQGCVWLEYFWQSPDGGMYQINVMRAFSGILVSFTFTSTRKFSDAQRGLFRSLLESYQIPRGVEEEA